MQPVNPDGSSVITGVVVTLTAKVEAEEVQPFWVAVTETLPPVVPTVAPMLFVVEVPDHVPGNDQV